MRNPVRSEDDAFRLLLAAIAALALIVLGAWINTWVGVAAAVAAVAVAVWFFGLRSHRQDVPIRQAPAASPPDEHRVLVLANETVGGPELLGELRERARGRHTRVLVVAPVPASKLAPWTGDEGDSRDVAQRRLDESVASMRAAGLDASGEVGEIDPVQAVEDAIRTFAPDELIVSTHPEGRSHWLELGLPGRLEERFALPLTHVVVDLDADHHG